MNSDSDNDSHSDNDLDTDNDLDFYFELIKCRNYLVCRGREERNFIVMNSGICVHCSLLFNKPDAPNGFTFVQSADCICCNTNTECIKLWYCNHNICPGCFRKRYQYRDRIDDVQERIMEYRQYNDSDEEIGFYDYKTANSFIKQYIDQNDISDPDHDTKKLSLKELCPLCGINR